jgi:hypothetical protein
MAKMAKKSKSANGATKSKQRRVRVEWSKGHLAELKKHCKSKTPVDTIAKTMGRTAGALRQKAYALGIPLGHRR